MDPRFSTFPTAAADRSSFPILLRSSSEEKSNRSSSLLTTIDYNALPTYPVRPSFKDMPADGNIDTHLVTFDCAKLDPYRPASMPIYQTAAFYQPCISRFGPCDYSRSGNPTRTAVEELVASLEFAHAAFAFNSGMAAIAAVTRLAGCGEEIICSDDMYGGSFRLFTRICVRQGVKTHFVDTTDLQKVQAVMSAKTRMLFLESPTNPLMRISDIRKLSEISRSHKALLVVDNTLMGPVLSNPLKLGCDIVIHSASQFMAGHCDTLAGFVCCSNEDLARQIAFVQNAEGSGLSPFDCWLVYRGLKTLALRQRRQQESAMRVASFLSGHPLVSQLFYPGLKKMSIPPEKDEFYSLHHSQASGGGSVISFATSSLSYSKKICDFCRIFQIAVSFGGCNSLIEMPCVLTHAAVPKKHRQIPEDLIRISVGLENAEDLLADLSRAMKRALQDFQLQPREIKTTTTTMNSSNTNNNNSSSSSSVAVLETTHLTTTNTSEEVTTGNNKSKRKSEDTKEQQENTTIDVRWSPSTSIRTNTVVVGETFPSEENDKKKISRTPKRNDVSLEVE